MFAVVALFLLVVAFVIINFFSIWLRALLSGAPVGFPTLIAMRLRGVPASLVVDARITSVKAGIAMDANDLEAHYLAEGNVIQTVQALIAADKAILRLIGNVLAQLTWPQRALGNPSWRRYVHPLTRR